MTQSDRMEAELATLLEMKAKAKRDEDDARQITLTKLAFQLERDIAKQRILEGKYLDASIVDAKRDDMARVVITLGRKYIDGDAFDLFIDDVIGELGQLWSQPNPQGG